MGEVIEGTWDDLIARKDLRGRRVRIVVLGDAEGVQQDPWLTALHQWANSHKPARHQVDDGRDGIYSGTGDDPR